METGVYGGLCPEPKYRPRPEPASGTAGGKVVKVDRVEWIVMKDEQTAANALVSGGVDVIEMPAFELYAELEKNPELQLIVINSLGNQFFLRFNHLYPPFNNPKIRQAAMAALNQPDFLQTQVGIPESLSHVFFGLPVQHALFLDGRNGLHRQSESQARAATSQRFRLRRYTRGVIAADRSAHTYQASSCGCAASAIRRVPRGPPPHVVVEGHESAEH